MDTATLMQYYWKDVLLSNIFPDAQLIGQDSVHISNFVQKMLEPDNLCNLVLELDQYPWVERKAPFMEYRGNPLHREMVWY